MSARLVALLSAATHSEPPRVGHFQGLPPDLDELNGEREQLPQARVLVIEQKQDGVFLCRYATGGAFAGDTWHPSVEEALEQAEYEYGRLIPRWQEVPAEVADAAAFATSLLEGAGHSKD